MDNDAPIKGIKVVVTGGRYFDDAVLVATVLKRIATSRGISMLGHGDATGLDTLAKRYCESAGILTRAFPVTSADWGVHGKKAGPRRNKAMLTEIKPDCVIAFPGGRGTANCVQIARDLGMVVIRVHQDSRGDIHYQRVT